ncbi:multidrug transporter, putative [Babesia ovata]|uniref:Multidrug transporter, putative n=1 Tax=Babesia ovata TaxID=189622 RepID=A0A2H6KJ01_9APIC|nr:multidrug transporter, putative [Babesia ovata]GBE62970.1 multidrug transporter, putative [Babesia ovata]
MLFRKLHFLSCWTTRLTWRIILPDVLVNLLLESVFEIFCNLFVSLVKRLHFLIQVNLTWHTTAISNYVSRLGDGRLGRLLDLLFGGLVERGDGSVKLVDSFLKLFLDFLKIGVKPPNLTTYISQPTVHGFGGANIWVGAGDAGFGSRRLKLTVKLFSCLFA